MTTKNSPLPKLQEQARNIAKILKAIERGERLPIPNFQRLRDAFHKGEVNVGIAMDDKVIQLTLSRATIRENSEEALVEWIVSIMREERPQ